MSVFFFLMNAGCFIMNFHSAHKSDREFIACFSNFFVISPFMHKWWTYLFTLWDVGLYIVSVRLFFSNFLSCFCWIMSSCPSGWNLLKYQALCYHDHLLLHIVYLNCSINQLLYLQSSATSFWWLWLCSIVWDLVLLGSLSFHFFICSLIFLIFYSSR